MGGAHSFIVPRCFRCSCRHDAAIASLRVRHAPHAVIFCGTLFRPAFRAPRRCICVHSGQGAASRAATGAAGWNTRHGSIFARYALFSRHLAHARSLRHHLDIRRWAIMNAIVDVLLRLSLYLARTISAHAYEHCLFFARCRARRPTRFRRSATLVIARVACFIVRRSSLHRQAPLVLPAARHPVCRTSPLYRCDAQRACWRTAASFAGLFACCVYACCC